MTGAGSIVRGQGGVAVVAVVGTGVIGASWAGHFLARGLDVVATDPAPGAEEALRAEIDLLWPTLQLIGLAAGAGRDRLTFTADAADAAARADFVQENGPERLDVKHALMRTLDEAARPDVVLASSSSGLLPSRIQEGCDQHPERILVGHPFNPPHLIPLVEVVAGERTVPAAVDAAMAFYSRVGKRPIRLRQEVPGHLANRMQAALWREAYSLVERGVATVADVDAAIAWGPGLRWALLGPLANQHLSGGPGGLRHVLEHLGPPMVAWWDDLGTPELTPTLVDLLVDGVDAELSGVDLTELVAARDRVIDQLLRTKTIAGLP